MTHGPRFPDLIARLPATVPFVGPEEQERASGHVFRARLGANESVFGPSPKAITALQAADQEIWKYADPSHFELKTELSKRLGCGHGNIVFGEGIDGCLGYLVRLLVEPGDAVVTSDGAYPTFSYHVNAYGGVLHKVPYRDDAEDIAALFAKAAEVDAKIVYLANPDNPMGSWIDGATIEAALDDLPEGTVLALDEAYIEFAPEGTAPKIDPEDPRVIRFRTFSKAYGLAGVRVGYGIACTADLAAQMMKARNPFGVNALAVAAARAALRDPGHLALSVGLAAEGRAHLTRHLSDAGFACAPSQTNFVFFDTGQTATDFAEALRHKGILIKPWLEEPYTSWARVTVGTAEENRYFLEAVEAMRCPA